MSGHIHWSLKDQKFGKEMIAWNALSRLLQQEKTPILDDAKQVIALAESRGYDEAVELLEEGYAIEEILQDSDYLLLIDESETILLNMTETPEQRKAVKEVCQSVTSCFIENAKKASNTPTGKI